MKEEREQAGTPGAKHKCVKSKITVIQEDLQIIAHSTFLFNLHDIEVLLTEEQIKHFSDGSYRGLICEKIPNFLSLSKVNGGHLWNYPLQPNPNDLSIFRLTSQWQLV